MKINRPLPHPGRLFLATALVLLLAGLAAGLLAAHYYVSPHSGLYFPSFAMLRPMHVTFALQWILFGATGCLYAAMAGTGQRSGLWGCLHWLLWTTALAGITLSYATGHFGGREYWEFPPAWATLLVAGWALLLVVYLRNNLALPRWPVYRWMWLTGILFFLFTLFENYLWVFSPVKNHVVHDLTIQWKASGSMVGAWNQLLYGTVMYLMEKISGDSGYAHSRKAFTLFFLGFFNLLFNWGHHIYTLPTAPYVRYVSYAVSMTELVFLWNMLRNWRHTMHSLPHWQQHLPSRYLRATETWVLLNLLLALCMSVPGINLYTHGTHITVAHAMGATIGINSMIVVAAITHFLEVPSRPWTGRLFWITQSSLFVFWLALMVSGIIKGSWQLEAVRQPFEHMMLELRWPMRIFYASGTLLAVSLGATAWNLLQHLYKTRAQPANNRSG